MEMDSRKNETKDEFKRQDMYLEVGAIYWNLEMCF